MTYEQVMTALRNADAAGDTQAARRLARIAHDMKRPKSTNNEGMGQLNAGIAGALDTMMPDVGLGRTVRRGVNAVFGTNLPEENPLGTSFAERFRGMGASVAEQPPQTVGGAFMRGAGQALGYAPAAGLGIGLASGMTTSPVAANVLTEAGRSLATRGAPFIEGLAGGLSEAGAKTVEQGGGGELAQNIARVATPMSIPAMGAVAGATGRAATNLPLVGAATNVGRQAARAFAPMSGPGARQVAREELARRTGSPERMRELGEMIDPNDPYGRTPAQQTGDPEMLGLERAAADTDPLLRERLAARGTDTQARMLEDLTIPGNVTDTRAFFTKRLSELRDGMDQRVNNALRSAREGIEGAGTTQSEADISARLVENVQRALNEEKALESAAWAQVPRDVLIPTTEAKSTARALKDAMSQAEIAQGSFPALIDNILLGNRFGDTAPHFEMKGLYSELRDIARQARKNGQNNLARVAGQTADAILRDFDAADVDNAAYAQARAVTRALHEKFDRGAVGRILAKDATGATRIEPEAAARRTLTAGPEGAVAARRIGEAAPTAADDVKDYLRAEFMRRATGPDGNTTRQRAGTWLRDNADLLREYPELRGEFSRALANQKNAEEYASLMSLRSKIVDQSPVAGFTKGYSDQAADAILRADDPAQAARSVVRAARQDKAGNALAGVKAALSDRLIAQATDADGAITGRGMQAVLRNTRMQAALRQVYSADEMKRLNRVADVVAKMDVAPTGGGEVINAPVNQLLLRVVQIAAGQQGGRMGASSNMGGSLQTANIMQRTATRMLQNLTNTKARQLLMDAVEDPELMRALMLNETATPPDWARSKLAPYLAGAASASAEDE